jgi:hypothetical protein
VGGLNSIGNNITRVYTMSSGSMSHVCVHTVLNLVSNLEFVVPGYNTVFVYGTTGSSTSSTLLNLVY